MPITWYPSILAADPLHLGAGLDAINDAHLQQVHLDIMDGHFVPNISFGPSIVKAVKTYAPHLFRDVHLMLDHPETFIPAFIENGAQRIYIHVEIETKALRNSITLLEHHSIEWSFAINPETDLNMLRPYASIVEQSHHLLVMSVHPGFSGQTFIPTTFERIDTLKQTFPSVELCIDGGIHPEIAKQLTPHGVSHFVIGANFFKK